MSHEYISLKQKTTRRTGNLIVVAAVLRSTTINTLLASFDGLAVVRIILISLDILGMASVGL